VIKILPIDEPGFLQAVIRKILVGDSEIKLFPSLSYDSFSIEIVEQLQPDVITIAVEEANIGVADIIKRIMGFSPLPIILHSESDGNKESRFLQSLEYGAVDYFGWPTFQNSIKIGKSHEMFLEKIHYWGARGLPPYYQQANNLLPVSTLNSKDVSQNTKTVTPYDLVVIGVSTGGVGVLSNLLKSIGGIHSPIVVALQVEDSICQPLIKQLSEETGKSIVEGETGLVLLENSITFIPTSVDGVLKKNSMGQFVFNIIFQSGMTVHPSIDQLFISAAKQGVNPVGIILSGHGDDGAKGALAFSGEGFPILVQDPESCLVNEMSNAVVQSKAQVQILSTLEIAAYLGRNKKV
jgi:two-component system, chemotaxis family, protein-glutamate methylesterase/glutaminase